nr:MAG TPA: hypothetical protein [Caudoviricetes sp.]
MLLISSSQSYESAYFPLLGHFTPISKQCPL